MNDPTITTPLNKPNNLAVENNPKSNNTHLQPSSSSSSSNSSTMINLHSFIVSFWENNSSSFFGTKLIPTTILTPGNILFCFSIPFCYRAYRDYFKFLKRIQKSSIPTTTTTTTTTKTITTDNPNQLGMMVASHALGIATRGSIGIFTLMGSLLFWINDWSSLSDAIQSTQHWAQLRRQRWITLLGIKSNTNNKEKEEEEYIHFTKETQHMSEEEQWNYLQKKYFLIQEEQQQQQDEVEKR